MKNELLILLSVLISYGAVLLAYRLFGRGGLYAAVAVATVLANIEVLLLVEAFGMKQTLGNVLFASTYLAIDILNENEGRRSAGRAVWLGIFASVLMLCVTGTWFLYDLSPDDWAGNPIRTLFSTTPRLLLGSFVGYAVSQGVSVLLYRGIWRLTTRRSGDRDRFLWLRNNAATLIAQAVNIVLFTVIAFLGRYGLTTVLRLMLSSYVIYIFTSFLDTPFVYLSRLMKRKGRIPEE